ncbi:MAG: type Z 30S ribosomal protein S14 [Candidatus Andersenbacteria bacterium]|nr:type Z 30S ribosomal protein S14 [Candidatus Andersenbacteria bacterium]MBI3251053.1 type Z 30S ribosomal protein S14 [Candidatus Andersenbacteria bacterium]
MATEAQIAKSKKKPKFSSRLVRRCAQCGRPRGYMRDFGLCRICFRERAEQGHIPGIRKSSW